MSFFLPVATAYPPSPASVTSVLVYGKWVLANRCACYGLSQPLPKHTSHHATPGSVFRGLFTALERKPTSLTCTLPASPLHSHGALLSFWIPGLPTRSFVCVRHCPHAFSTGTRPSSFRVLFKVPPAGSFSKPLEKTQFPLLHMSPQPTALSHNSLLGSPAYVIIVRSDEDPTADSVSPAPPHPRVAGHPWQD